MQKTKTFSVHAPGRICLLGEHQDYFGLEVISGAMNLGICLTAEMFDKNRILIATSEQTRESIVLKTSVPSPAGNRNYLQSGLNCMLSNGYHFTQGYRVRISGNLPIGKGVSSSSALCVGWIKLLAAVSDEAVDLNPLETARLAYETEVLRFSEPGGMQDHIASASGGLLHMNFQNEPAHVPRIVSLEPVPDGLLLVDSGRSKDTLGMLKKIRSTVEKQYKTLFPDSKFKPGDISPDDIPGIQHDVPDAFKELRGTLHNLFLTRKAVINWPGNQCDLKEFLPPIINEHHDMLSRNIGCSSEYIDECIEFCLRHGAAAGKVIGSGGGGCFLVYAPENPEKMCQTLDAAGLRFWPVRFEQGVSVKTMQGVLSR